MRLHHKTATIAVIGLAWLTPGPAATSASAQKILSSDPRVENRTYRFADTNEDIPYCVFVSSKVSRDKKNPLIVSLHGLGYGPGDMCQGAALDLAEAGGYILVAPMGYNTGGWYGTPVMNIGGRGRAGGSGFNGLVMPTSNPANLPELSEKDVLNVVAIVRKEFNVDERRTYLMGWSMGGAATFHLGGKHAKEWAALAAIGPAAFLMSKDRVTYLQRIKDAGLPLILIQGEADTTVTVASVRPWAETMKELRMDHEYKEIQADHYTVTDRGMPDIFAFFQKHRR